MDKKSVVPTIHKPSVIIHFGYLDSVSEAISSGSSGITIVGLHTSGYFRRCKRDTPLRKKTPLKGKLRREVDNERKSIVIFVCNCQLVYHKVSGSF